MKILPQEFHFEDTSNSVRVKTVVPLNEFSTDMLVRHIRHFRLGAGTIIKVQIMSKDYDAVLHSADFLVVHAIETMKRIVDESGERTATITDYKVIKDTEWTSYTVEEMKSDAEPERVAEKYVPGEGVAKWNPGKKTYEIIVGDEVVGEERDKELALAKAAGSEAL